MKGYKMWLDIFDMINKTFECMQYRTGLCGDDGEDVYGLENGNAILKTKTVLT